MLDCTSRAGSFPAKFDPARCAGDDCTNGGGFSVGCWDFCHIIFVQ